MQGQSSTIGYKLTRNDLVVKRHLEQALADFSRSLVTTRLIRRFSLETPDLFCNAVLSILEKPDDSAGQRYLVILLLKQPALLPLLTDPSRFTRQKAIELFKQFMAVDPTLDVRLAHCLPNRDGVVVGHRLDAVACERALDILDETSCGRRIIPIIGHLVHHADPRVSSKAALTIGKRVQNANWAARQLEEQENARVRANAIEAIWGLDTPEARDLLWRFTRDENNRLAGNAWFGLHILQEEKVNPSVMSMAVSAKPNFRATAAWVMGKIGDSLFFDTLTGMVKDEHPAVRTAALRALTGLAQKAAKEAEQRKQREEYEKQKRELAVAEKERIEKAAPVKGGVDFVSMRG